MNNPNENVSMALFCDFENVALGVRDTKYQKFDIRPVLERLLLKGSIVVKKAYCDWERYKEFKAPMHEANFELIEIPHVRQSGKNSADIRLVVDALDFCYTKSHVNTFVIISGDSDFSPLVSKLRENDKKVIGVGVKQSTSDLLIANCDEFIFYDDLAREGQRTADARRDTRGASVQRRSPDEERRRKEEQEARKTRAVEMVVETFEALVAERGDSGKIWASALKDALKRRKPDFNESYYGFRAFGNLLEEAQSRGFLEVGREEKSGTYVYRDSTGGERVAGGDAPAESTPEGVADHADAQAGGGRNSRKSRGGRKSAGGRTAGQQGGADRDDGASPSADHAGEPDAWKQPDAPRQTEGATVVDAPALAGQMAGADQPEDAGQARSHDQDEGRPPRNARQADRRSRGARPAGGARRARDEAQADAPSQPATAPAGDRVPSDASQAPAVPPPTFGRPPQPLPQSALVPMPPPVVNVGEWTFVTPPVQAERERPAKAADPVTGPAASPAAEPAPAAKRGRGARKTAAKAEDGAQNEAKPAAGKSAPARSAAEPAAAEAAPPAKPARKTARKTAPRAAKKATQEG
ncbi:NYN domain-containing protein [Achromobacter sp. NFACC18-2]|uniref:NYN domain-containing protein n=1 Tax=Achromobacter sp. NFACC18-2 TaxID=1564112 RepID=UPI0008B7A6F5|nr:NYN domain-containing protein [Achromobacter sp. NFACC18-2]SEI38620.1 Uncharacterized conserved protein, LabA/DUF88 family [Achromobacter sp. NFACC18-2]